MNKTASVVPNERLRQERQRRGWSRAYVAEQIGVADPKTVGRWERGWCSPSSYFLHKLCTLFNLLPQDLGLEREARAALPALLGEGAQELPGRERQQLLEYLQQRFNTDQGSIGDTAKDLGPVSTYGSFRPSQVMYERVSGMLVVFVPFYTK